MSELTCHACLVFCIDFRLHEHLNRFVAERGLDEGGTDVVRVAGAAKNLARPDQTYARDFLLDQLDVSRRLHGVREIYLVNHEDCGAYGLRTDVDADRQLAIHRNDLQQARSFLKGRFPDLKVFAFYQHLDGRVEKVD